ncbi:transmembrane protein 59 isoform X1 [Monodelphis domestica]|uniref:transmembrane protein 59 isoform X1 n=1 Tax=Monodelphis domestica TaxID=13616 RepID=UPI0024E232C5|nr:transmembrane protein 59 isoform X1 [Monodelphis domestica]
MAALGVPRAPRLPRSQLLLLPLLLVVALSLPRTAGAASAEAFDSVLGDTASCHRACQMTYPLHTYPKGYAASLHMVDQTEEELYACQRGCRLFSICQFVDDGIDLNRTKLECESACTEAYSQPGEQFACHLGCQSQLPFAELRQEQLMSLMPKMHLLFPLTLVRSFWSDMMDSAQSFITSSWTFYLQADDGKIVIFQSKPEIQYPTQVDRDHPAHEKNTPLKKMASNPQPAGSQTHRGYFEDGESDSFFKCLSLNSGWIVTITLVLSVLVLLWICCATVATAMEQYVPSEEVSKEEDGQFSRSQKKRAPGRAPRIQPCPNTPKGKVPAASEGNSGQPLPKPLRPAPVLIAVSTFLLVVL